MIGEEQIEIQVHSRISSLDKPKIIEVTWTYKKLKMKMNREILMRIRSIKINIKSITK